MEFQTNNIKPVGINFKQQRYFNQLMNTLFEFVKQEFKVLGKALILYAGPLVLIYSFFMGLAQSSIYSAPSQLASGTLAAYAYMLSFQYLIAIIFSILGNVMIMTTVYSYIVLYVEFGKDGFTADDLWDKIKSKFLGVLGTFLLLGLIMIAIAIPSIILLEVPLIWISVATCLTVFAYVNEDLSFGGAFSRSFNLIKNNWWKTFGLLIIVYLIAAFAGSIFLIPQMIVTFIQAFHAIKADGQSSSILLITFTTIGSFCATLLYSLIYVAIALLYYSLVEEKEKPSLMSKIQEINMN